jgi:hypothetical protein
MCLSPALEYRAVCSYVYRLSVRFLCFVDFRLVASVVAGSGISATGCGLCPRVVPGSVLRAKVSFPTCILLLMSGRLVEASLAHVSRCPRGVVVRVKDAPTTNVRTMSMG